MGIKVMFFFAGNQSIDERNQDKLDYDTQDLEKQLAELTLDTGKHTFFGILSCIPSTFYIIFEAVFIIRRENLFGYRRV